MTKQTPTQDDDLYMAVTAIIATILLPAFLALAAILAGGAQ